MAAFIASQKAEHGIPHAVSCRALGVSQSWLYKWLEADPPPRQARRDQLTDRIQRLFHQHNGTYGAPHITADLRDEGWRVSENTAAEIMREQHLAARRRRRRRSSTRPGKTRWRARTRSCTTHRPGPKEYTAGSFRAACDRMDIRQSMGRAGSALDNAVIESWHSTLEFELRRSERFATKADARARVPAWLADYNQHRRHSALDMPSPIEWEHLLQTDHGTEDAA